MTIATNMAGRGTDIKLSPEVAANGGLHVILTEFHESSRVDRQLYGRSGRQGDPGSCEAVVALDDELFVRFLPRIAREAVCRAPFLRRLVDGLRTVAQSRAERHALAIRRSTSRRDADLDRILAVAGPRE